MNEPRKLELSKETLRCLDDQDLTGVAGGNKRGGGENNNSFICIGRVPGCSRAPRASRWPWRPRRPRPNLSGTRCCSSPPRELPGAQAR